MKHIKYLLIARIIFEIYRKKQKPALYMRKLKISKFIYLPFSLNICKVPSKSKWSGS